MVSIRPLLSGFTVNDTTVADTGTGTVLQSIENDSMASLLFDSSQLIIIVSQLNGDAVSLSSHSLASPIGCDR